MKLIKAALFIALLGSISTAFADLPAGEAPCLGALAQRDGGEDRASQTRRETAAVFGDTKVIQKTPEQPKANTDR